jgi:hypothetical protein
MSLPPMTVAEMILITNAITAAPFKSDATPGPFATSLSFPQLGRKLSPSGNWLSKSHSNGFLPGCDCHGYYRTEENLLVRVSFAEFC